jgi:ABC-2 type transport system permease protein
MPCSLLVGGTLDFGKLAANILALLLMAGAFGAIGLYMSCLASHPIVAAMGAFGGSFVLWILDWSASLSNQPSELIKYLSILRHFQNIQSGLITSADLSYFLLFISLFLMLSIRQLEKERLQK